MTDGEVQAIPMPEVGGLPPKPYRCPSCGRKFFTLRGYQGHYALEHIIWKCSKR